MSLPLSLPSQCLKVIRDGTPPSRRCSRQYLTDTSIKMHHNNWQAGPAFFLHLIWEPLMKSLQNTPLCWLGHKNRSQNKNSQQADKDFESLVAKRPQKTPYMQRFVFILLLYVLRQKTHTNNERQSQSNNLPAIPTHRYSQYKEIESKQNYKNNKKRGGWRLMKKLTKRRRQTESFWGLGEECCIPLGTSGKK